jgi:acyl carrier protein
VLGSLEFAGLLLQVADEFDVKFNFEDMDLDRFRSVAGIASFITQHRTA